MNPLRVSIRVLLSTGVMAGVFSLPLQAGSGGPAVGEEAPAFELPGSDGNTYSLSDYRGKRVVVLAWFPKAFTGGCTLECNSLRASGRSKPSSVELEGGREMDLPATTGSGLDRFDIALSAASCDSPDTKPFCQGARPRLSRPERPGQVGRHGPRVVHEGRAYPERWTFIIGVDGRILDVMTDVDAGAHGTHLAARLEELGVPHR